MLRSLYRLYVCFGLRKKIGRVSFLYERTSLITFLLFIFSNVSRISTYANVHTHTATFNEPPPCSIHPSYITQRWNNNVERKRIKQKRRINSRQFIQRWLTKINKIPVQCSLRLYKVRSLSQQLIKPT